MPKQVKKNPTEVAETTAPTTTTTTAAAVEAKVAKPKAAKKAAEPKAATPVEVKTETPVAVTTPVVEAAATAVVADDIEAAIAAKSAEFSSKLGQLASLIPPLSPSSRPWRRTGPRSSRLPKRCLPRRRESQVTVPPLALSSLPSSLTSLPSSSRSPPALRWPALMSLDSSTLTSAPTVSRTRRTVARLTLMLSSRRC